jgi:raffinose/stachyose/melibiose transport system substrate-binding protein
MRKKLVLFLWATVLFFPLVTFADTAKAAGSEEITYWYQANVADPTDSGVKWHNNNLSIFKEQHPEIKVNATVVSNGDEYLNKISTAMAAGQTPDIFQTWMSGRLKPFVDAGRVLPLDAAIEKNPILKKTVNKSFLDTATFDGKVYAIPNSLTAEVVFYNKAIFRKYNLSVPKTWNDLMNIVKTLRSNGVVPMSLGNSDPWTGSIPYMAIFDRLVGKDLYAKVCLQNKALWNDPAFVKTSEYLLKLKDAGAFPDNFNSLSNDESEVIFQNGKAGMRFMGTWEVAGLYDKLGKDLGFFNFPAIPEGTGKMDGCLLNKDSGYAIGSQTKHAAAAETFLAFIFSPARQKEWAEYGNLITTQNVPYDKSKIPQITNDLLAFFGKAGYGIIPWDNPLGVNIGKEFNQTTKAVLGGEDPTEAFGNLQQIAVSEWGN